MAGPATVQDTQPAKANMLQEKAHYACPVRGRATATILYCRKYLSNGGFFRNDGPWGAAMGMVSNGVGKL